MQNYARMHRYVTIMGWHLIVPLKSAPCCGMIWGTPSNT